MFHQDWDEVTIHGKNVVKEIHVKGLSTTK